MCVVFFVGGLLNGIFGKCTITQLNICNEMKIMDIFVNNFKVGISILCIGAVSGGIYGIGVLMVNGHIVGELIQFLVESQRGEWIIRGLLPHICVELAGLICFAVVGFMPIIIIYYWLRDKYQNNCWVAGVIKQIFGLLFSGVVLLLIAAVLECKVSSVY